MSFTFLAKSLAYSWKISFAGQVDCQRMLIGPCALTTEGAATVAAEAMAAPRRNLRRLTVFEVFASDMKFLPVAFLPSKPCLYTVFTALSGRPALSVLDQRASSFAMTLEKHISS